MCFLTGFYDEDCPDELEQTALTLLNVTHILKPSLVMSDASDNDMVRAPALFIGPRLVRNPHLSL